MTTAMDQIETNDCNAPKAEEQIVAIKATINHLQQDGGKSSKDQLRRHHWFLF
jgi:hypothetical protein